MINKKIAVSTLALTMAAGGATAQVATSSHSAGVALMAPNDTGFLYGANLGVNGVGSGAVTVTQTAANHRFLGQAGTNFAAAGTPGETIGNAQTASGVLGTFEFNRAVTTSGSLAGIGSVMAEGEALGASGFAGAAFANATSSGVEKIAAAAGPPAIIGGTLTQSTAAETESEAGLSGSLVTRNRLSLAGTNSNFAGSLGTTIGETGNTISYSRLGAVAGDTVLIPSFDATTAAAAVAAFVAAPGAANQGVAFATGSALAAPINLAISSAGGGSQSLSVSTGGFFTGGASAFGENDFNATFVAENVAGPI